MADESAKQSKAQPTDEEHAAAQHEAPAGVQSVEPEDAHLTGGSKSHLRRLLDLNVDGTAGQSQKHPETPAGQHATGSFTFDEDDRDDDKSK